MTRRNKIAAASLVVILGAATGALIFLGRTAPDNQTPTAQFTISPETGDAPLEVRFDGSTSSDADGRIAEHAWDFGDGQHGSGPTPTHRYAAAGTFNVTLTVTDDKGAAHATGKAVTVTPAAERYAPLFTEIEPADGAVVRGTEAWVRWRSSGATKGIVRWRKVGDAEFRQVDAQVGSSALARVGPLESGAKYEYVVGQASGGIEQRSSPRTFTVHDGLAFEPGIVEQSVRRDYAQIVPLTLHNTSKDKVRVAARALVHIAELPTDIVGVGSVEEPTELAPGAKLTLRLAVTSVDATRASYEIPVEAAGAVAIVRLKVELPVLKLSYRVVASDKYSLAQTIEIRNEGDPQVDLSVRVVKPNDVEVDLQPAVNHAPLPRGGTLRVIATPVLYLEFESLEAVLECKAAGQSDRYRVTFKAPPGQRLIGIRTGCIISKIPGLDWYCTNRPFTITPLSSPPHHGPIPKGPPPIEPDCSEAEQQAAQLRKTYQQQLKALEELRQRASRMNSTEYAKQEALIVFNLNQLRLQWQILQEECPVSGDIGDPGGSVPPPAPPVPGGMRNGPGQPVGLDRAPGKESRRLRPGLYESLLARATFSRQHRGPFAAPVGGSANDSSDFAAGWHAGDRVAFVWHHHGQVVYASFGPDGNALHAPGVIGRGRRPRLVADGNRTAVAFQRGETFVTRVHDGDSWGAEIPLPGQDVAIGFAPNGPLHAATSTGLWKLADQRFDRLQEAAYIQPALAFDPQGKPHVASLRDGKIVVGDVVVGEGERPSLLIASDGTAHVAYVSKGTLFVRSRKGDKWSDPEAIPAKNPSWPALALGKEGVRLTYLGAADKGPGALWLVRLPGKESVLMPSLAGNVTDAALVVNFELKSTHFGYRPHDVCVSVNDVVVGTFDHAIPEGRYLFPLNPYQLFASPGRPVHNQIAIHSWHMNPGHYSITTDYQIFVRTPWSERFLFAANESEARKAPPAPGHNTNQPDLTIVANKLKLPLEEPKVGRLDVAVTVANLGDADSRPARLLALGAKKAVADVPALKPGESRVITMPLEYTGQAQFVTFQLRQDPDDFDPKNDSMAIRLFWGKTDESSFIQAPTAKMALGKWEQQGTKANGNWVVSADGASVVQTLNGDPTFLVSPEIYSDVTIKGKLKVEETDGDDDYIGFVFGYQGPVAKHGDEEDDWEFLLFDWKEAEQDVAPEGSSLVRVSGSGPNFWNHASTPQFKVLATNHGAGTGWRDNKEHDFELVYQKNRIKILLDGKLVFDVKGSFPAGRFGFYNYSQASVRYSNFTVQPTRPGMAGNPP